MTVFFLVHYQDIERCLQALEELEAVPVTSHILQRNAEVIATLKKVCLPSLAESLHFFVIKIFLIFFSVCGSSRSGDIKPALQ